MLTLENKFHNTTANIRAELGDIVPRSVALRASRKLCGIRDCGCGTECATFNSLYTLAPIGYDNTTGLVTSFKVVRSNHYAADY